MANSEPQTAKKPDYRPVKLPKRIRLPLDAYESPEAAFHVVFRAMPGTSPFRDPKLGDAVWALVTQQNDRGAVGMHAACLMPDHLHAVVSPRSTDLIKWVNSFKSFTTRTSWASRPNAVLWQPGFYDRRLRDDGEFEAAVLYVMNNPVAAGKIDGREAWPWVGSWIGE